MYLALTRLTDAGYLKRITRRTIGGTGAGSGQTVYQLGRKGWALMGHDKAYWPYREIDYHTLAIADTFMSLARMEREQRLRIEHYDLEPDSWLKVGNYELRPDMRVRVRQWHREQALTLWIETDLGTERYKHIKEKVDRYWAALERADERELDLAGSSLVVLFVASTDQRATELRRMIDREEEDVQRLFLISTQAEYAGLIFG